MPAKPFALCFSDPTQNEIRLSQEINAARLETTSPFNQSLHRFRQVVRSTAIRNSLRGNVMLYGCLIFIRCGISCGETSVATLNPASPAHLLKVRNTTRLS